MAADPLRNRDTEVAPTDPRADGARGAAAGSDFAHVRAGGRMIARNTLLNLLGLGLPMLVALFAIPVLVQGLGTERFGVLAIAWMAIGYFSLFDLGLGRAVTHLVAERLGRKAESEIPGLVWAALLFVFVLGAAGGLLLAALAGWVTDSLLRIPLELRAETRTAFYLLALALPWVTSTAALRGVLEAGQRFGTVNALRVPLGVLTFAGPLVVLPFSSSLVPVVAVLAVGRFIAWLAHLHFCLRTLPWLRGGIVIARGAVRPLLRFGSWMTVSNLISPLMVYVDRLLIGALISMAAVAYYVTPYEVVTRLWLVPAALVSVLFPAFASGFARDRAEVAALFDRGVRAVFVALFPLILVVVAFAHEGLEFWLGTEFAINGTAVLQWLAAGILINSVGQIPFTVIQGAGRADITGKLHLAELPIYLVLLWWLLHTHGIGGAAMAWTARVTLDTVALLIVARRFLRGHDAGATSATLLLVPALVVLAAASRIPGASIRAGFVLLVLGAFAWLAWTRILSPSERILIRTGLRDLIRPGTVS
jgi:O-antigen/teichoic acid export membrane protein